MKITKESEDSSEISIDIEALEKILNNPNYKDHLVAICTIAGPFRSGKSFLLNLLISYIRRHVSIV